MKKIWSCGELNPRPLECKSSALPTELQPQILSRSFFPLKFTFLFLSKFNKIEIKAIKILNSEQFSFSYFFITLINQFGPVFFFILIKSFFMVIYCRRDCMHFIEKNKNWVNAVSRHENFLFFSWLKHRLFIQNWSEVFVALDLF